jgi:hypothetical protein
MGLYDLHHILRVGDYLAYLSLNINEAVEFIKNNKNISKLGCKLHYPLRICCLYCFTGAYFLPVSYTTINSTASTPHSEAKN